ncbi:hypothetical protein VP1G_05477 [Cytospora mali]|uniref:DNA ligase D 3'-phosphoesterase domain-containing protein n=1 Tax=Cytospora mali TaxID=578113 RepID=A0A194V2H5_CYTMA|nr:hypothetical protein VP1G_05477 [Valsa mali var. pyri (nom. inval.)]
MDSLKKRKASPGLVSNPFIKRRNLEWRISPPPFRDPERRRRGTGQGSEDGLADATVQEATAAAGNAVPKSDDKGRQQQQGTGTSTSTSTSGPSESALIENNTVQIEDHLSYFSGLLSKRTLLTPYYPENHPRLPIQKYKTLYRQSLGSRRGAHFVVTQHDHPVAGPHYDLRLQINETSSCSWAIMYGLPGDANARGRSGRTGGGVLRNATETRVHCLWNHLVETAGPLTGSLMVWDTGRYEVLPDRRRTRRDGPVDSQEMKDSGGEGGGGDGGGGGAKWDEMTQQEKLARAFAARKIRLRLHGTRLPRNYVVNLRLTQDEDAAGRAKAAAPGKQRRSRRRGQQQQAKTAGRGPETSSDSDVGPAPGRDGYAQEEEEEYNDGASTAKAAEGISEMEKELRELEDEQVRRTNAYTGAVNTIGSVHQRKWFLSLDREACGFEKSRRGGKVWWERRVRDEGSGDVDGTDGDLGHRYAWPFYVRGPDYERSVVTGRLGADILRDEGVVGYVRRKGWRPIMN